MGKPIKITTKPTRAQLLDVIGELQSLVGNAKNAFHNDRVPNRVDGVVLPLEQAFELCVASLSFDPPRR